MTSTASPTKKLRVVQLAAIIFLTVSGGPYGLESLLSYAGKDALILLLIVPLLWDVPTILTILELNSMMPVTGGYYQWVKRALGLRWAFYEGWWTWLYTFVDLAIYPVLFVEYAAYFFPNIHEYKIPLCLFIIWASAGLNIRGIMVVGESSLFFSIAVLLPFVVLFAYGLSSHGGTLGSSSQNTAVGSSLGMALYTIMWNFLGWDNVTTYAGEVKNPIRSYLTSISIAFVVIFLFYFLTVLTAQWSGIDYGVLSEEGFPALGNIVGGPWLAALLSAGGMVSALGLFCSVLLSISRVPQVMSDDKLLPAVLHKLHPKFNTPYISIIVCALVVSGMIFWTFADLIIIDITIYGAGLFLEFVTLIVLRLKVPDEHRPFKIPLKIAGLCLMLLLPMGVYVIALKGAFMEEGKAWMPAVFAIAALLSAEVGWLAITLTRKKNLPPSIAP